MTPRSVRLRIDRLVLDGVAGADRERLTRAVETELGRLLRERGVPASLEAGRRIPSLDAGQVELRPGSSAEGLGAEVARAVYGGFRK